VNLDAAQLAICDAAISLVYEGNTPYDCSKLMGVARRTLMDWLKSSPQMAARYARAREDGWDALAERALHDVGNPATGDPKSRKVLFDARLKVLSRWCPARYGESMLPKVDDSGVEREELTQEQIVERLAVMLKRPIPLALTHDDGTINAEFTPVGE
jgi:hypothetical protein